MRASPAWFTARPLASYPSADTDEEPGDTSFYHGVPSLARHFCDPGAAATLLNRRRYSSLALVVVLGVVVAWLLLVSVFQDAAMRWQGIPPGLWSHDGSLKIGREPFYLKGVSWYGLEGPTHCLEGLTKNSLNNILDILVRHNFNALRIPFAFDKWNQDPRTEATAISSFANPDLKLLSYRQLMRVVVQRAADRNILVLLDMHRLDAKKWPSDGKWMSDAVSSESLIKMWEQVAREFGRQWNVIGADIFNEVSISLSVM